MSDFYENFLDMENYDTVILTDEEGNEVEFEKLAFLPMDDKLYVVMTPALPEDEEVPEDSDIEIAVFEVENDEGNVSLTLVTDEDVNNAVIEALLAEDDGEDEGEDEE